jgi:CheY-like chemotaxis protein
VSEVVGVSHAHRALTSVLLVDDNVSTGELIGSMLDRQRFNVVRCMNGREALQALEVAPYDVVLMDLSMPELDGWSALRFLRRREAEQDLRRTPVIALGTAPLEVERERCLRAGFDDHLCKPVRKSSLLEAIERATIVLPADATTAGATDEGLRLEQQEALTLLGAGGLIDVRAAVESLGGDATLYLDAIEHLVPALGNWPSRFQEALNRREFDRARQMAQDMQSILDVVAAVPCAASLGRMAVALASPDDLPRHAAALADLDRHLQPLVKALQQAVERIRNARQERLRREQGHNSAF